MHHHSQRSSSGYKHIRRGVQDSQECGGCVCLLRAARGPSTGLPPLARARWVQELVTLKKMTPADETITSSYEGESKLHTAGDATLLHRDAGLRRTSARLRCLGLRTSSVHGGAFSTPALPPAVLGLTL